MQGSLEAHDPAFHGIIDRRSEVVAVATGFQRAQGPVFGRVGLLLFADPPASRILQYAIGPWKIGPAEGSLGIFSRQSGRAQGLTLDHQGRLLVSEGGPGRVVRHEPDGSVTVLASHYRELRLSGPADLVYAIDGSIYFTDSPRRGERARAGRTGLARLYQITPAGELRMAAPECDRPAGVGLGPRQLDLFVTDSTRNNIRVFPIAPDGALLPSRVFAELTTDRPGRAGGIKTDEEGNVYAAGPGGVWVFNRDGLHLGTILLPEAPSNLCWGRGFIGLYMTARKSLYYVHTRVPGTRSF
jgi:gluconolactonase